MGQKLHPDSQEIERIMIEVCSEPIPGTYANTDDIQVDTPGSTFQDKLIRELVGRRNKPSTYLPAGIANRENRPRTKIEKKRGIYLGHKAAYFLSTGGKLYGQNHTVTKDHVRIIDKTMKRWAYVLRERETHPKRKIPNYDDFKKNMNTLLEVFEAVGWKVEGHQSSEDVVRMFIEQTGIVRVNFCLVQTRFELTIESYHPLTHSQRRFLLDIIETHSISPDEIIIEGHSEEQVIKRQLRVNFF